MALTGLQIFKLLPNKNCRECGVPTCLAFAMKLAAKSVEVSLCPYISDESISVLSVSQSPPIRKVQFKLKDKAIDIGAETVMYRHDKTFINQPVISLEISDKLSDKESLKKIEEIKALVFERVGQELYPEALSLVYDSGDAKMYVDKYKKIRPFDKIIILRKVTCEILTQILEIEDNHSRLVIDSVSPENFSQVKDTLVDKNLTLVLSADTLEDLFELATTAESSGFKNLILKVKAATISGILKTNVILRRLALKKNFKAAGYPILTECEDAMSSAITAICKYSSIIVLKDYSKETLFPLLTLRQNIYADPQKPLQIQPGIYPVGEPTQDAPLVVTTNFSLTYFIVSAEIENSPYAGRLLITDSEGMSVLTAWSADKFSPELIAQAVKASGVEKEISHKKLIIPGYVATIKGELEDKLPDWEILVGPQEAADLPSYLKETWKA
ncbi:MAG: acetyl-CoA decarbonylase/synthase complex subunit gamma [Candidatus Omnitrophota bacterium]